MGQAPWLKDLRQKCEVSGQAPGPSIGIPQRLDLVTAPVASDSPAVSVTEISDPASAGAGVELIDLDAVQLESLPLRARRVIVRLGAVSAVFHTTDQRLCTHTSVQKGMLGYVTFGPQSRGTVNGVPVRPGLLLAAAPESAARFVVEPGWESITFLVPPDEIRSHWMARRWEGEFRPPKGVETLQASEALVRGLFDWGKRLVETAVEQPALFNEGEAEQAAAQVELIEALLATLRQASDFAPSRGDRTRRSHSQIVKRAEQYALARTGANPCVSDLCRAVGVSERTLEYAFKGVMGLTPMAYLTRLRLHRVRKALLAAPPGSTTVSAEAISWGFWHFGAFARAYKACFGELPSETLLRRPEPRE
jgi:AraC family transcriptional regulator, ethanolamine operon transcriptional activator